MNEQERIAAAQAMIAEMARRLGVAVTISQQIKRVDDGSVIVIPSVNLTLIPEWRDERKPDNDQ